jgi:hypothetical protein
MANRRNNKSRFLNWQFRSKSACSDPNLPVQIENLVFSSEFQIWNSSFRFGASVSVSGISDFSFQLG